MSGSSISVASIRYLGKPNVHHCPVVKLLCAHSCVFVHLKLNKTVEVLLAPIALTRNDLVSVLCETLIQKVKSPIVNICCQSKYSTVSITTEEVQNVLTATYYLLLTTSN